MNTANPNAYPNRRQFLKVASGGLAGWSALHYIPSLRADPPSERVRHAVIGVGSRGWGHCRGFAGLPHCELVAVCDVDPQRAAKGTRAGGEGARPIRAHADFRTLLEDPTIDSVSIATCDHWHTPIALAALMAGKHVYLEKPCSHNVRECRLLVQAAREYGKCVQHGTQRRSWSVLANAWQALREGVIGKVYAAKAIDHQRRGPIGRAPVSEPPPGVNYDLWLGPAPKHAFTLNRWHYKWHWFWDYGCGDIANDGIHQIDVARWGLGVDFPRAVVASGAQLFYDDDHETPDTQNVVFDYDGCHLIYEMRLWTPYRMEGHDNGTVFYGTEGRLDDGRDGVVITFKNGRTKQIEGEKEDHFANYLEAVRANDPGRLAAPIDQCATSAVLCHLGNIATRGGGRRLVYDPAHDRVTECGGHEAEANQLLTRQYRKGYELPYPA